MIRVLQLQYLRQLPDPLGPSTLNFPPSFSPYLDAGGLTNASLWPELNMVRAPKPVSSERIPGVGGLKYSETIVGKNGGFSAGMRVRGRRRTYKPRGGTGGTSSTTVAKKMHQRNGSATGLKPVNEHEEAAHEAEEEEAGTGDDSSDDEDGLQARLAPIQPPTVTVQSPQRSPTTPHQQQAHSQHARTLSGANQTTPSAHHLLSEEHRAIEDLLAETAHPAAAASAVPDSVDSPPAQAANPSTSRSRPVTLIPEYSHDKELSDALLWEEDRHYPRRQARFDSVPEESDEAAMSPSESTQDQSEASTVDTQPRMIMAQSSQDPSPFSYYPDVLGHGNGGSISNAASFNLVNSSASIMEGASEAALQSRRAGRLRRGPSEPELEKFKEPSPAAPSAANTPALAVAEPPPPPPVEPKKPEEAEAEAHMPLPLDSVAPLRPAGMPPRRERRRVNISFGKLNLGPPPPPSSAAPAPPLPQPTAAVAAAGAGAPSEPPQTPSKRHRAGTDPPPASNPSPTTRRQASSDAQPPTAASLAKHPSQGSLRQQQQAAPLANNPQHLTGGRTSPLKPLALLSPRTSDERTALVGKKPASPLPLTFAKTALPPAGGSSSSKSSSLSAMIAASESQSTNANPFNHNYGALIARPGDATGLDLKLFFPQTSVKVRVKSDVSAEEVIGCGLYKYWEGGLKPPLLTDAEKEAWDGESLVGKLDPARWNLHMVEDEDSGEVDDDFPGKFRLLCCCFRFTLDSMIDLLRLPALDRTKAISAFSFQAFAIVPASEAAFATNTAIQSQIQRRPSRLIGRPSASRLAPSPSSATGLVSGADAPAAPSRQDSQQHLVVEDPSDAVSTSLRADRDPVTPGPQSHAGAGPGGDEVLLRVRIPVPGLESVISTVKVTTKTYLADVVETICKKRREHLGDAKSWVLMLGDRDIIAPTDRTVESLRGNYSLRLVKKKEISGLVQATQSGQLANTNPSASIFKRLSEPAQPRYVSASDVTPQNKVCAAPLLSVY